MVRYWLIVIIITSIMRIAQPLGGVIVLSTTQTGAEQHPDGLWYLLPTGEPQSIAKACSLGNCTQGFHSLYEANQYWGGLLAEAAGGVFVPLPPPPG